MHKNLQKCIDVYGIMVYIPSRDRFCMQNFANKLLTTY
jgi:hypothetical protein